MLTFKTWGIKSHWMDNSQDCYQDFVVILWYILCEYRFVLLVVLHNFSHIKGNVSNQTAWIDLDLPKHKTCQRLKFIIYDLWSKLRPVSTVISTLPHMMSPWEDATVVGCQDTQPMESPAAAAASAAVDLTISGHRLSPGHTVIQSLWPTLGQENLQLDHRGLLKHPIRRTLLQTGRGCRPASPKGTGQTNWPLTSKLQRPLQPLFEEIGAIGRYFYTSASIGARAQAGGPSSSTFSSFQLTTKTTNISCLPMSSTLSTASQPRPACSRHRQQASPPLHNDFFSPKARK